MAHRSKIIKEWVDVKITTAGSKEKGFFEVDKHAARIIGIAISSNFDEQLYHRGTQRISINEKEIYPEGYESKMLMQGLNIKVNDRIIELGEEVQIGNRKVEIEYTDTNHPLAAFSPYRVRLYVYSLIND
ncbi:hypothetical protein [Flavobacterium filum]|uniref:hypothetical protein n=1 Tax=Flavobacterium filum TaxID=370974 RepID=UPI0023F29BC4|nr:hypothetical protein [Flavobacterium filum]